MRYLIAALLLAACASEVGSQIQEVEAEDGAASGVFVPVPDPPEPGVPTELDIALARPDGSAVDGAELRVVPWMPAHGHGSPRAPVVAPAGEPGRYAATDVYYNMSGAWELRIVARVNDEELRFVVPQDVR